MPSQIHKGDIVRCIAGDYKNHYAKVKKVDRHNFVHLDIGASEKIINPLSGRAFTPKISLELCEIAQERLIDHG